MTHIFGHVTKIHISVWSIGGIREDIGVVRWMVGLDVNSKEFAVSSPYLEGEEEMTSLMNWWVCLIANDSILELFLLLPNFFLEQMHFVNSVH